MKTIMNFGAKIWDKSTRGKMAETVRIAGLLKHSSVNGPGIRAVLFFQGCEHRCPFCQNPETWNREGGTETAVSSIIEEIRGIRYLDGLTLSGGDPFLQAEAAARIAASAKSLGLTVWCYTGYTFEELISENAPEGAIQLLENIDCLVDGKYVDSLRSESLLYRGSSNQRLIDAAESLATKLPKKYQNEGVSK